VSTKEKTPEEIKKEKLKIVTQFPYDPLGSFKWWLSSFNRNRPENEKIYADDALQFDIGILTALADKYEKNKDYVGAAIVYEHVNELAVLQMSMVFPKVKDEKLRKQHKDLVIAYFTKDTAIVKKGIEEGQLKEEVWRPHITRNDIACEMMDDVLNSAALFYKSVIIDAQTKESEAKEKEEKRVESERKKLAEQSSKPA
jgi:hypothetical protein